MPPADVPSRTDLLANGGVYPVVVPLGWNLVGSDGRLETIPHLSGSTFHRILARGALLAVEPGKRDNVGSMMMFTSLHARGPVQARMLDAYAQQIERNLTQQALPSRLDEKRIFEHASTGEPRGKLVMSRLAPGDTRLEVHYLVSDATKAVWQLVYLIRSADVARWGPLLAELEGGA